ncbi:TolC family protein [Flavobacteriaceae bacterium D16]|nr:TolC family protein [Flavobacteriaceae bacterium D16]
MKRTVFIILVLLSVLEGMAQDTLVLNFKEYLGYVKKYHPIARQAELQIGVGQANLMKARGGFDPKLELDYERKEFDGTEYYDRLNATFKVPTWFGIELKGNFEQNEGVYINPDETVPADGLYSAGVSVPVGQGLWINDRMATLRKAKFFREQTKADRDLAVNTILFEAAAAYFDWLQAYRDQVVFRNFLTNARIRFEGIRKSAMAGDLAAIDTVEARIAVENRELGLEQAKVKYFNKSLQLSNFLWLADNVPVELQENVIPDIFMDDVIDTTLEIEGTPLDSFTLENHPKLRSLEFKVAGLEVDKRLKANKLLPRIDLEYNFLTATPELINSFVTDEYKGGVNVSFPLFLRKERGDLKLAKFKLSDAQFEFDNAGVEIQNKIRAIYQELDSFDNQNRLITSIVTDYQTLLSAEERKFSFGESSLFLINSRESKLIEAELKRNQLQNKYYFAKAKLFRSLAINPKNL